MKAYIYGRLPETNEILLLRNVMLPDTRPETLNELETICGEYLGATDIRIVVI